MVPGDPATNRAGRHGSPACHSIGGANGDGDRKGARGVCKGSTVVVRRQSLFITGTDTGVGKTVVTALLALHLQQRGANVGVMKPFATGCERHGDELVSDDARWLKAVVG